MPSNPNLNIDTLTQQISNELDTLRFAHPVTHVYNPLNYAWNSHRRYLSLYGQGKREILLLGMNPGPWGMAQNGVPFGDTIMVRDWLGIEESVGKPPIEHPKRPILGFENTRREVSGKRLWGWARDTFQTPERFFQRFFIINYCPLAFFNESGQNLTPDKLPVRDREPLLDICDRALQFYANHFQSDIIVGIGGFAEKSAQRALSGMNIRIGRILHPSPASPAANRGWEEAIHKEFSEQGITW